MGPQQLNLLFGPEEMVTLSGSCELVPGGAGLWPGGGSVRVFSGQRG